ncbi:MAG: ankyrin repeat domain-containing protein [Sterolibacterium sp.]|jgi:ankyrin repeat protein|nr:ankyrin repeat domain-containing protein [Sterolibacterium sp.]
MFRTSCSLSILLIFLCGIGASCPNPVLAEPVVNTHTASTSNHITRPNPTRFALTVEQGDLDTVRQWLAAGLPADFMGDRIGSGLMIAAWEGHIGMMELFLQHGAPIEQANRYDETALLLATWRGHLAAVRWLLDHGAQPARPGARWSALHYAAFANQPEISRLLIERGAEINARAPNGSTVLMMAAREGHEELTRQLLAAGADPKAVNERGESALIWAMRYEHYSIAQRVANQEDFAQAVKAAPTHTATPQRSVAAPPEIDEILRQLRLAEAAGQPTQKLRATLLAAVERYKKESQRITIGTIGTIGTTDKRRATPPRGKPNALVITARRNPSSHPGGAAESGERAELVYRPVTRSATSTGTETETGTAHAPSSIPDILARIQRAQAVGQPVDALREELFRAVAQVKNSS